jgi:hypothetical protein
MKRNRTDQELTAEIEREIEDGSFLKDLRPIKIIAGTPPRAVYTLRLSLEEAQKFDAGAKARGMTLSDFLRSCALASLDADRGKALGEVREKARALTEAIGRL